MKASELRIGNWIHNPVQSLDLIVDGSLIAIEHNRERVVKNHEGFEPIPLTEEWLIKLGFCDDKKIGYVGDDFVNGLMTVKIGEHHIKIKYVHQLQNLYFALTNEELTIN